MKNTEKREWKRNEITSSKKYGFDIWFLILMETSNDAAQEAKKKMIRISLLGTNAF